MRCLLLLHLPGWELPSRSCPSWGLLHRLSAKSKITFTWIKGDLTWQLVCALQSAKIAAIAAVLKWKGYGHAANKLRMGMHTLAMLLVLLKASPG